VPLAHERVIRRDDKMAVSDSQPNASPTSTASGVGRSSPSPFVVAAFDDETDVAESQTSPLTFVWGLSVPFAAEAVKRGRHSWHGRPQ
jgi:hypothetical protein